MKFLVMVLALLVPSSLFARTFTPANSSDLNTLLTGGALGGFTLACGDTMNLTAGVTYTGNYVWPLTNCVVDTILQTTPSGSLPGAGVRTGPAYAAFYATLAPALGCAEAGLVIPINADHVQLLNLKLDKQPTEPCGYPILKLGQDYAEGGSYPNGITAIGSTTIAALECSPFSATGGSVSIPSNWYVGNHGITYTGKSATSGPCNLTGVPPSGAGSITAQIPNDVYGFIGLKVQDTADKAPTAIVVDHLLVDLPYLANVTRVIMLNSGLTTIKNSYLNGAHRVGQETNTIGGWNGPGPHIIDNNTIYGTGQSILYGGASGALIVDQVPSDITVTRNLFTKDLRYWSHCVTGAEGGCGGVVYAGTGFNVKNIFESKSGQRILLEGNIFEHSWAEGQSGSAILFTARDQTTQLTTPDREAGNTWLTNDNIMVRNNIIRKVGEGITIYGQDNHSPNCLCKGDHISIVNNLFYRVGGDGGDFVGKGHLVYESGGPRWLRVEHNTFDMDGPYILDDTATDPPGFYVQHFIFDLFNYDLPTPTTPTQVVMPGFIYRNNLARRSTYGFWDSSGSFIDNVPLAANLSSPILDTNVLAIGDVDFANVATRLANLSLMTNAIVPNTTTFNAAFVNRATGDYNLVGGSAWNNAATDGTDIGVDMAKLAGAGTSSYVCETGGSGTCTYAWAAANPPVKLPLPLLIAHQFPIRRADDGGELTVASTPQTDQHRAEQHQRARFRHRGDERHGARVALPVGDRQREAVIGRAGPTDDEREDEQIRRVLGSQNQRRQGARHDRREVEARNRCGTGDRCQAITGTGDQCKAEQVELRLGVREDLLQKELLSEAALEVNEPRADKDLVIEREVDRDGREEREIHDRSGRRRPRTEQSDEQKEQSTHHTLLASVGPRKSRAARPTQTSALLLVIAAGRTNTGCVGADTSSTKGRLSP